VRGKQPVSPECRSDIFGVASASGDLTHAGEYYDFSVDESGKVNTVSPIQLFSNCP
jgi:hypothetical protein